MRIYLYGSEILRQHCADAELDKSTVAFARDMVQTLHQVRGIGLAAPQVGRPERIVVVSISPVADILRGHGVAIPPQPMILINPEIVRESENVVPFTESCLSIPKVKGTIYRPESIRVQYWDEDLNEQTLDTSSALARVIQHEVDHLHGVLFIDHLSSFEKKLYQGKLQRLRRAGKRFVQV